MAERETEAEEPQDEPEQADDDQAYEPLETGKLTEAETEERERRRRD